MDIATVIGIVAAFGLVVWGIMLGGSLTQFWDPPSVAIVLGGTSGIGLGVAVAFAHAQAEVLVTVNQVPARARRHFCEEPIPHTRKRHGIDASVRPRR